MFKLRRILAIALVGIVAGMLIFPATALAAFGIDPGKVYVDNLSPGSEGDFTVTIYNQDDSESTYTIVPRKPDYTAAGYEALPDVNWITVTPDQITVKPQGKSTVQVIVLMPKDSDYSGKKAEAWLSFKETGDLGMVQIELASRVFISTRGTSASQPTVTPGSLSMEIPAEAGPKLSSFSGPLLGGIVGAVIIVAGVILFLFFKKKQHV